MKSPAQETKAPQLNSITTAQSFQPKSPINIQLRWFVFQPAFIPLCDNKKLRLIIQNTDPALTKAVFLRIIGTNDDEPPPAVGADEMLVECDAFGIKIGAGFIQQQAGYIGEDGLCQFHALFHAGAVEADLFVSGFGETDSFDDLWNGELRKEGFELLMKMQEFGNAHFFNELQVGSGNGDLAECVISFYLTRLNDGIIVCCLYGRCCNGVACFSFGECDGATDGLQQSAFA